MSAKKSRLRRREGGREGGSDLAQTSPPPVRARLPSSCGGQLHGLMKGFDVVWGKGFNTPAQAHIESGDRRPRSTERNEE